MQQQFYATSSVLILTETALSVSSEPAQSVFAVKPGMIIQTFFLSERRNSINHFIFGITTKHFKQKEELRK